MQASKEDLVMALESDLTDVHLFAARMQRQHIQYLETQLEALEREIHQGLVPYQHALALLQTLPGVDKLSAAKLVIEMGTDMRAFGHPEKLAMWAGICPGNHQSAGKRKSGKAAKGNASLRSILCQIAWAATRTTCQFKDKYKGLAIRLGTQRAIIAIAHKILKIAFVLLQRDVPYKDPDVDYQAIMVKKNAPRWIKMLKRYGFIPQS